MRLGRELGKGIKRSKAVSKEPIVLPPIRRRSHDAGLFGSLVHVVLLYQVAGPIQRYLVKNIEIPRNPAIAGLAIPIIYSADPAKRCS